ncbi:MAG TPA: hypothetical protein VJB87_05005 [Candidatus Nanoarchaeia archaeon]|nr:hypothetical protein [Candidatus Nanoarchaeia archaeon]
MGLAEVIQQLNPHTEEYVADQHSEFLHRFTSTLQLHGATTRIGTLQGIFEALSKIELRRISPTEKHRFRQELRNTRCIIVDSPQPITPDLPEIYEEVYVHKNYGVPAQLPPTHVY